MFYYYYLLTPPPSITTSNRKDSKSSSYQLEIIGEDKNDTKILLTTETRNNRQYHIKNDNITRNT